MARGVVLTDVDGTITTGMSFLPMLEAQVSDGIIQPEVAIQARLLEESHGTGHLSFETYVRSLLDTYASGVAGRPVDEVEDSINRFYEEYADIYSYVKPTFDLLKPTHDTILVTSNVQFAAVALANRFGTSNYCSSVLSVADGRLVGKIDTYLVTRHQKRAATQKYLNYKREGSFAFGDSVADINVLRAVENPICIAPSAALRVVGEVYGWPIIDSPDELNSSSALTIVTKALSRYKGMLLQRELREDNEYFQSQYNDAHKVKDRFAMYLLEICKEGDEPFNPDHEIAKTLVRMGVPRDAPILDMGASDGSFLAILVRYGYQQPIGVDPNSDQFKKGQRKISALRTATTDRLAELISFSFQVPGGSFDSTVSKPEQTQQPSNFRNNLFIKGNANQVPVRKGSVRVYTAKNMLYHLKDIEGALEEALFVLEPRGVFFASTSGEDNKLEHREDENQIKVILKRKTGKDFKEPPKMNDGFTTEKAKLILPKYFKNVYCLNHEGVLLIKDDESKNIYRKSLYSMYDQFDPIPDWQDFVEAVEEIIDGIGPEGKQIKVSRSVFACSNSEIDPGPDYKQVFAEAA